jgi:hypothetical protein
MEHTRNIKIIAALIIAGILLLGNTFVLKPSLEKRSARKIANKILIHWINDDLPKIYDLWLIPKETPPLYGISDTFIMEEEYYKKKDPQEMDFIVVVDFNSTVNKSGNEWKLSLVKTKSGWKAREFILHEEF